MHHLAGEHHCVGDLQFLCQLLQRLLFRTVADDHQPHVVLRLHLLCPEAQQNVDALFAAQAPDKAGNSSVQRDAQLVADFVPLFLGGGGRMEGIQLDRVGDDLHLFVAADLSGVLLALFGWPGDHVGVLWEDAEIVVGELSGQRNQRLGRDVVDVVVVHGVQGVDDRHL